jgi:spermidine synthase
MPEEWIDETWDDRVRHGARVQRWLYDEKSAYQHIQVAQTEVYGRVLMLDGLFQTSECDEHYYHEMLVHPAMTTAPSIERVLIIGGGDGGTAREVLRYDSVREVVMVEIDESVVRVCREFLPGIGTAFEDPRLELCIGDGVRYLAEAPAKAFDVIILDGSDPVGPSEGLFGESFYRHCARALSPSGVFALQSESYVIMDELWHDIQRALAEVFPRVHPYFGFAPIYGTGMWSWTHCSTRVDPLAIVNERAEAIEATTRYYHRGTHTGAFALPNELRRELRQESPREQRRA